MKRDDCLGQRLAVQEHLAVNRVNRRPVGSRTAHENETETETGKRGSNDVPSFKLVLGRDVSLVH
jgi:hypothetical protein